MIEKINTYWPIYKNLEKEVVALSYNIMFSDDLLNTYSVKIADLITALCSWEEAAVRNTSHSGSQTLAWNRWVFPGNRLRTKWGALVTRTHTVHCCFLRWTPVGRKERLAFWVGTSRSKSHLCHLSPWHVVLAGPAPPWASVSPRETMKKLPFLIYL